MRRDRLAMMSVAMCCVVGLASAGAGAGDQPPREPNATVEPNHDPVALYHAARRCLLGIGAAADWERSAQLLKQSADRGYAPAMANLAYFHCRNSVSGSDPNVGIALARKALPRLREMAAANDSEALLMLGFLHFGGVGTEQDFARGIDFYRRAAEAGNAYAMEKYSNVLRWGVQTPVNLPESRKWLRRSAEAGDARSMCILALHHVTGQYGDKRDLALMRKWLERSAAHEYVYAMYLLGKYHRDGTHGYRRDWARAALWYEQAAMRGDTFAMQDLAGLYREGGPNLAADPNVAEQWQQRYDAAEAQRN